MTRFAVVQHTMLPFVALLLGCSGPPPGGEDITEPEPQAASETAPLTSDTTTPQNVNERIAVLEKHGFTLDHKADDYVQYVRGSIMVDLDLDDDGIHVTPTDESATAMTDEMLESAAEIYDLMGIPIRDLTYHVTRSDGIAPDMHEARIRGWSVTMRHWPKGVGSMFVAFSVERE